MVPEAVNHFLGQQPKISRCTISLCGEIHFLQTQCCKWISGLNQNKEIKSNSSEPDTTGHRERPWLKPVVWQGSNLECLFGSQGSTLQNAYLQRFWSRVCQDPDVVVWQFCYATLERSHNCFHFIPQCIWIKHNWEKGWGMMWKVFAQASQGSGRQHPK